MLRQLTIKWFRGIRDGLFEGFGPVNLLVGPNSCGKSSFLEAVSLLAAKYADHDPLGRSYREMVCKRRNEQDAFPLAWWHQFDQRQDIEIIAGIEEHLPEPHIQQVEAFYSPGKITGQAPQPDTVQKLVRTLFMDVDSVRDQAIEEQLWPNFYRRRLDKPLIKELNEIYDLGLESVSFSPPRQLLVGLPSIGLPLDSLGAGTRMTARLLIAALAVTDSILLLEEIDAFQAPSSLKRLAGALTRIAAKERVQVFISTHRLQTVSAFLEAEPELDAVRVLPISRSPDGVVRARALGQKEAATLASAGVDFRELYGTVHPE